MSELQSLQALHDVYKARTGAQVDAAMSQATVNFNFFYALRDGDIGYHYTGLIPVRANGWDPRLPMPLSPETAWSRMVAYGALPHVTNPKSGLITNWNNKPVSWWLSGDLPAWGAIDHKSVLDEFLTKPHLSPSDLELAAWGIARTDESAAHFQPALQDAKSPFLRYFDGRLMDGSVASSAYGQWLDALRGQLFLDVTGEFLDPDTFRMIMQPSVILKALEGRTKTDFLHGRKAADVVRAAEAKVDFRRRYSAPPILPEGVDPIPYSNRGSYIQIMEVGATLTGRNVLSPGEAESGDHRLDQVNLAREWLYKPMYLLTPEPNSDGGSGPGAGS
jgi:penicillin amidase